MTDRPKLTPKQEKFARGVASGKTQADAYRDAYNAASMKPETIHKRASELMEDGEIAGRVKAIQDEITAKTVEKTALTREDIIEELEEAREIARQGSFNPSTGASSPQSSAMVAASMGKAKLLGFSVDKVEHSGVIGVMDVAAGLTEDQKKRACIALLRTLIDDPEVKAFGKDVVRADGYDLED